MKQKKIIEKLNKSLIHKHIEKQIWHEAIGIEIYLKYKYIKDEYGFQVSNLIFCINIYKKKDNYVSNKQRDGKVSCGI